MAGVEEETAACGAGKSSSSGEKKMVILKASDGEVYEVEEAVARMSPMLSPWIDETDLEKAVPLYNVTGRILGKVIDYCKKHSEEGFLEEDDVTGKRAIEKWDAEYVDVDRGTLAEIIMAANYLEIKGLLGLACQKLADWIKDLTVEEVRKVFDIENDYTEEEEAAVRNEYAWVYEERVNNKEHGV